MIKGLDIYMEALSRVENQSCTALVYARRCYACGALDELMAVARGYWEACIEFIPDIRDLLGPGRAVRYHSVLARNYQEEYWLDEFQRRHGISRMWDPDGSIFQSGEYFHGKPDGLWRYWHTSGQLSAMGVYDRGRRVGLHSVWSPDGVLVREDEYGANGELLLTVGYDDQGRQEYRDAYDKHGTVIKEVFTDWEKGTKETKEKIYA